MIHNKGSDFANTRLRFFSITDYEGNLMLSRISNAFLRYGVRLQLSNRNHLLFGSITLLIIAATIAGAYITGFYAYNHVHRSHCGYICSVIPLGWILAGCLAFAVVMGGLTIFFILVGWVVQHKGQDLPEVRKQQAIGTYRLTGRVAFCRSLCLLVGISLGIVYWVLTQRSQ